jgi:hypothetical protein
MANMLISGSASSTSLQYPQSLVTRPVALLYSPAAHKTSSSLPSFSILYQPHSTTPPQSSSNSTSKTIMHAKSILTMLLLSVLTLLGLALAVPTNLASRADENIPFHACLEKFAACDFGSPRYNKAVW